MSARRWISPLRYPGGKARMSAFLGPLFLSQYGPMDIEVWVEPFAGGAGAGLALLDAGIVSEVWLTEKNPALATFWQAVTQDGHALAARVEKTEPSLATWAHSKEVVAAVEAGEELGGLETALAAFVLNRCSRSGIVDARVGPIGGKNQDGRWSLASRFNSQSLAERLRYVAEMGSRIRVTRGDALDAVRDLDGSGVEDEVVLFVDPPYIREGNGLYAHGMSMEQHQALADALNGCPSPWMLTYDDEPCVAESLYPDRRVLAYEIAHTANRQRIDWEYAVFSDNLLVPAIPLLKTGTSRWVRESAA